MIDGPQCQTRLQISPSIWLSLRQLSITDKSIDLFYTGAAYSSLSEFIDLFSLSFTTIIGVGGYPLKGFQTLLTFALGEQVFTHSLLIIPNC
jgi:hypothetical protein